MKTSFKNGVCERCCKHVSQVDGSVHTCTPTNGWRAMEAENERLRTMLQDLVQQLDSKNRGKVDAPGHSHNIPGVWDNDNGELAGKPCAWCALWREAKAMVQPHNANIEGQAPACSLSNGG